MSLRLMTLFALAAAALFGAQGDRSGFQTSVTVRIDRARDHTTYRYVVWNRRQSALASIFVGLVEGMDEPELAGTPLKWEPQANNCPQSIVVPAGWRGCVGSQEESAKHFLVFEVVDDKAVLAAGAWSEFSVTLARKDATYETPVFWAIGVSGVADKGRVAPNPRR